MGDSKGFEYRVSLMENIGQVSGMYGFRHVTLSTKCFDTMPQAMEWLVQLVEASWGGFVDCETGEMWYKSVDIDRIKVDEWQVSEASRVASVDCMDEECHTKETMVRRELERRHALRNAHDDFVMKANSLSTSAAEARSFLRDGSFDEALRVEGFVIDEVNALCEMDGQEGHCARLARHLGLRPYADGHLPEDEDYEEWFMEAFDNLRFAVHTKDVIKNTISVSEWYEYSESRANATARRLSTHGTADHLRVLDMTMEAYGRLADDDPRRRHCGMLLNMRHDYAKDLGNSMMTALALDPVAAGV